MIYKVPYFILNTDRVLFVYRYYIDYDIMVCFRFTYLCTSNNPVSEYKTWLATIVWISSRASPILLLKSQMMITIILVHT